MGEAVRVEIVLPVGVDVEGHVMKHLGGRLSPSQALSLKRLWQGLRAANCELANGKRVEDGVGAVRWMLEQYGAAVEGAVDKGSGEGPKGREGRGLAKKRVG
jgi:hypothetical protein